MRGVYIEELWYIDIVVLPAFMKARAQGVYNVPIEVDFHFNIIRRYTRAAY